jgi:hypothetical protein
VNKIETLRSEFRINSAIRQLTPRKFGQEVYGILFLAQGLYPIDPIKPDILDSYFKNEIERDHKREWLRGRINKEHPEWNNDAPKKNVIIDFLNT